MRSRGRSSRSRSRGRRSYRSRSRSRRSRRYVRRYRSRSAYRRVRRIRVYRPRRRRVRVYVSRSYRPRRRVYIRLNRSAYYRRRVIIIRRGSLRATRRCRSSSQCRSRCCKRNYRRRIFRRGRWYLAYSGTSRLVYSRGLRIRRWNLRYKICQLRRYRCGSRYVIILRTGSVKLLAGAAALFSAAASYLM